MKSIAWAKVFRNIWRINGVAILLLLALALGGLILSLTSGLFRGRRQSQASPPNLAPQEPGKPELRLGGFSRIGTSTVMRAELRELGEDSFRLKGSRSVAHNVLFLDTSDGKSWWLLPDSNAVIAEEHELSVNANGTEVPLGRLYLIDPSGNEDRKDSTLLLADAKGTKQVVLAKGRVLVDELATFSAEEARLLYHDAAGYRLALLHPTETRLIKDIKVNLVFPPRK